MKRGEEHIHPHTHNTVAPALTEILDLIREDLIRVEAELAGESESGIEPVRKISTYLLEAGGKRLRPVLHLLAAHQCRCNPESAVRIGAILELIHNATLIHDDVIDAADTRRGRLSTNSRWGNSMTVLAGDWLYMQAFSVALRERNLRILDILIRLTQQMVEGELIQLTWLGRSDIDEASALDIARRKTARLFETSTRLAAVLAGRPQEEEERLASYGLNLGLAFQIVDDVLDFTASAEQLGKPVLSDLREGKVTLPLVYSLEASDETGRTLVDTVLRERTFRTVEPGQIEALVQATSAVERARDRAADYAEQGRLAVLGLPDSPYKRALEILPQYVLNRDH